MNRKQIENKFLDYIEGTLSQAELEEIEKSLASDEELMRLFDRYQQVVKTEKHLRESTPEISSGFVVKVMDRIEDIEIGFFRRLYMKYSVYQKLLLSSLGSIAILVLLVKLSGRLPDDALKQETIISIPVANEEIQQESKQETEQERNLAPQSKELAEAKRKNALPSVEQPVLVDKMEVQGKPQESSSDIGINQPLSRSQVFEESRLKLAKSSSKADVGAPNLKSNLGVALQSMNEGSVYNMISEDEKDRRRQIIATEPLPPVPPAYQTSNTEAYSGYEENPNILVTDEAISTFSIDVDTASYSNARRFLSSGQLPPKNSIRIEEFINYFQYDYPTDTEKPFNLSYELAPSPLEQEKYLLKLGIKARDISSSTKPWNLVFLIDVSGSMADSNKLDLVKQGLGVLVNKMKPEDRIALVTYAGNAGLVLPSTTIREKDRIMTAINTLNAGGSTNGSGGINLAYQVAEQNKMPGAVNRVVLATDGDFNVGITSNNELIKLIEEKRRTGITLTTLGVGTGNLKDGMMEQLADKGNGNYFYLDNFQEARKVMETDIAGTIEVVAKDVKLQIEFNPKHVHSYRLIGYDNRKLRKEDFNNDVVDAGEIGSGHTVTALYEIVLVNSNLAKNTQTEYRYQKQTQNTQTSDIAAKEHPTEIAYLKVRYKEPEESNSQLLEFPIESNRVVSDISLTSSDLRFAAAVSYFGTLLRGSKFIGNYDCADIAKLAENALGQDTLGYRREFVNLVKNANSLITIKQEGRSNGRF